MSNYLFDNYPIFLKINIIRKARLLKREILENPSYSPLSESEYERYFQAEVPGSVNIM